MLLLEITSVYTLTQLFCTQLQDREQHLKQTYCKTVLERPSCPQLNSAVLENSKFYVSGCIQEVTEQLKGFFAEDSHAGMEGEVWPGDSTKVAMEKAMGISSVHR